MKKLTGAEINALFKAAREEVDRQRQEQAVEPSGKLTKLSQAIAGMGNKLRVGVTDQWHALRNIPKKRRFMKWCREKIS